MTGDTGGFRLDLGEPAAEMLADFCEAFFRGNKTEVIRQALLVYIPAQVSENPGRGKLYEELQRKRLGLLEADNVHVLKQPKD
jgi:hypothetical protein